VPLICAMLWYKVKERSGSRGAESATFGGQVSGFGPERLPSRERPPGFCQDLAHSRTLAYPLVRCHFKQIDCPFFRTTYQYIAVLDLSTDRMTLYMHADGTVKLWNVGQWLPRFTQNLYCGSDARCTFLPTPCTLDLHSTQTPGLPCAGQDGSNSPRLYTCVFLGIDPVEHKAHACTTVVALMTLSRISR